VAGDVDFGVSALISGNLASSVPSLARRWFDRFVEPARENPAWQPPPTHQEAVATEVEAAGSSPQQEQSGQEVQAPPRAYSRSPLPQFGAGGSESGSMAMSALSPPRHRGPSPSLSRIPSAVLAVSASANHPDALRRGHTPYVLPSALPRDRHAAAAEEEGPLPPAVRYFRMGGGDGHKTSQGHMMHGGVWMAATAWPPPGNKPTHYYLQQRKLVPAIYDHVVGQPSAVSSTVTSDTGADATSAASGSHSHSSSAWRFTPHTPPESILSSAAAVTVYDYDPRHPCPSIGGNLFGYRDVLLAGAWNQVERAGHFLCCPPYLPLEARRDVLVFRTDALQQPLDVTGSVLVHLLISSDAVDTDFTAKLVDEYPPSPAYPAGYAMNITHGITRASSRYATTKGGKFQPLVPGQVEEITIQLYPTSNLFAAGMHTFRGPRCCMSPSISLTLLPCVAAPYCAGHTLRLDISSSNFPHFDLNMGERACLSTLVQSGCETQRKLTCWGLLHCLLLPLQVLVAASRTRPALCSATLCSTTRPTRVASRCRCSRRSPTTRTSCPATSRASRWREGGALHAAAFRPRW